MSALLRVVVVVALAGASCDGCGSDRVTPRRIDEPASHWLRSGYTELVPPVRLPTDREGRDHIAVWIKLGDGPITSLLNANGPTLRFPAGTIADRVESMGDAVIDVRGTTLTEAGELFHVYVPEATAPSALVGWEWLRGDDAAQAAATRELLRTLDKTRRRIRGMPEPSDDAHARSLASYQKNNACAGCHAHDKALTPTGDVVHRPTDANGFFVPLSLFADAVPLERHRPWDANANDPFLTLSCSLSGGAPRLVEKAGLRHYVCQGSEVPLAVLDVPAALRAGDARAVGLCASRRFLGERMDATARALFRAKLEECTPL